MLRKPRLLLPLLLLVFSGIALAQETRHFTFHYAFTVKDIPSGEKVRIWIPQSHSDAFQTVKVVSATGDLPLKKTHESKYENEIYFAEASKTKQPELHFEVVYDVVRRERLTFGIYSPHLEAVRLSDRERREYLAPDVLVPTTGLPAELAAKVTDGKTSPLGDVLYACDAKKGNCTDFHSLFIAMARSQGIPARFEIGFPLPPDRHSSEIAGYHCWAEFFEPQHGWIPVDISEAWKHPEKRDYFFGAHDDNRVEFTMGRDLELSPKQDGKPLNYFVYPYVEVEGKEYPNISTAFSFADVDSGVAVQR